MYTMQWQQLPQSLCIVIWTTCIPWVGAPDQVITAFATVKQQLQSVRLECNRSKSCFIYLHDEARHPLPPAVVSSLADDGTEIKRDYAEVLGAIIGANEQAFITRLMSSSPA